MKKAGYIAIVGRPNVGKSTLLNALLGEKVAIVSAKPQTTRNRILGILTEGETQFIFVDTPGIHRPQNRLGDYMVEAAKSSMLEADVVVLMADVSRPISSVEENVITYLKQSGTPCVLALNKTDLVDAPEVAEAIKAYAEKHDFQAVVPTCAKNGKLVGAVLAECEKLLDESEWFFPEDMMTDQPERQMAAEIIREKLLRTLNKEVPHGVAVVIEEFKDEKTLIRIRAEIFCEKASHKGIIVGKGGAELKRVGTYAREDLEKLFGTKVFLDLWVKVKENWRESAASVGNFGYREEK
ncbi:MAG: GTPase Era [Clostridia bacterium]|nr:GTPase Era [Clostridia bacterium]